MAAVDSSLDRYRIFAPVIATAAISAAFLGMIESFLITLFLAAIFSSMSAPLYGKILPVFRHRRGLAAGATVLFLVVCVMLPALGFIYLAATQARDLTTGIMPIVQELGSGQLSLNLPDWLPFREQIQSAGPTIASKVGEITGKIAGFFVSSATALTRGTAHFFLQLFVLIYAMVFFLQEQTSVLTQIMRYSGLSQSAQERLIERAISISRATIKGTLVIGVIQGTLGAIGLSVAGIGGAVFWGIVMAVASVIPGIGPSLVLVPAVIYLFVTGETTYAFGLAIWAAVVVSTIDNLLRPTLVGRDAQMNDLLILVSTLGGLAMFGAVGLIIGPVLAGLFVTCWNIFSESLSQRASGEGEDTPSRPI